MREERVNSLAVLVVLLAGGLEEAALVHGLDQVVDVADGPGGAPSVCVLGKVLGVGEDAFKLRSKE